MFKESVGLVNRAVADDMTVAHQHVYFQFHCDDRGFGRLANLFRATEEIGHIERIAERILFLKGEVRLEASETVQQISEVKDMLSMARQMEEQSIKDYNFRTNKCDDNAGSASQELVEDLLTDEERHFNQHDGELDRIELFGDSYLALQSITVRTADPTEGGTD